VPVIGEFVSLARLGFAWHGFPQEPHFYFDRYPRASVVARLDLDSVQLRRIRTLFMDGKSSAEIIAMTGATADQVTNNTPDGLHAYCTYRLSEPEREKVRGLLFSKGHLLPVTPASAMALKDMYENPDKHAVCDTEFAIGSVELGMNYIPYQTAISDTHLPLSFRLHHAGCYGGNRGAAAVVRAAVRGLR
jgi:hypothetical protein